MAKKKKETKPALPESLTQPQALALLMSAVQFAIDHDLFTEEERKFIRLAVKAFVVEEEEGPVKVK